MNGLGFSGLEIPAPTDWQAFERLCRDLWAARWDDPNTQLNGRNGQPQCGIDIYGQPGRAGPFSGVQCKRRNGLPDGAEIAEGELRAAVEEAKSFSPAIEGEFVLATTARRDAKIQLAARELTIEHARLGLFRVTIVFWEDIQDLLGAHPEICWKHYPGFLSSAMNVASKADPEWLARALGSGAGRNVVLPGTATQPELQAEFGAELDDVWALVKQGRVGTALDQARALRARIWHQADNITKGRLLVITGYAKLEAGKAQEAAALLIESSTFDPTSPRCAAATALGHSVLGNSSAAKEWAARALSREEGNLVAIQVAILHDASSDEAILAELEPKVGSRVEIFTALGHRARESGDHDRAVHWFERALAVAPDSSEALAAAGECAVDAVAQRTESRLNLASRERAQLDQALARLGKAWTAIRDPNVRLARAGWLHARLVAARLLGRDEADELAVELVALDPQRPEFVRARAAVASDRSDHEEVIRLLGSISQPAADDLGLLATAHASLGAYDRATEYWLQLLEIPGLPGPLLWDARRNHCLTLIDASRNDEARTFVAELFQEPVELSHALLASIVAERLNDQHWRDELLDRIAQLAVEHQPAHLLLMAGDHLVRSGRTGAAVEVYQRVVDTEHDSPYAQRLVGLLIRVGRVDQALQLCAAISHNDGPLPFYVESEAIVHEALGNLPNARAACEKFLRTNPESVALRIRLAAILQRLGDDDAAGRELDLIPVDEVATVATHALFVARLLAHQGRPGPALEVLYRACRANPNDEQVHVQYFTAHPHLARQLPEPDQVTPGTAAEITGTGAPGWVLVCGDGERPTSFREYEVDHALARALIGKSEGDAISFEENPRHQWNVGAVCSKYAFAFRQTLETFFARFPTARGIEQYEVPEDKGLFLQQVKERLEEGEPRNQAIEDMYLRGHITVGGVARVIGRSSIEALGVVAGMKSGLQAFSNTAEEKRISLERLEASTIPLVLDVTAIVTLEMLQVLRDGTLAARNLVVPQTCLDEIQAEYFRWRTTPQEGSMALGLHEGKLVRNDTSAEEVLRLTSHYRDLVEWVRAACTVVGVSPATDEAHHRERARELLGASSWDSVLIAKEHGTLVSDDLRLRALARNEVGVTGVCTAALLLSELRGSRLSAERYADCILTLQLSGYRSVPTDANVLLAAARRDGWSADKHFRAVASTLEGPGVELASAASVGVQFLRALWLEPVLEQQRLALIFTLLDSLATGRTVPTMVRALEHQLRGAFSLLPVELGQVLELLSQWRRLRLR